MFTGTHNHSIDTSGRFIMPQGIKEELGSDFIITKGVGCLCVYKQEYAAKLKAEISSLNISPLEMLLNPDLSRLYRLFFSEIVVTNIDKQNRVQLSSEHREYAEIKHGLIVMGCGEYVEIWGTEARSKFKVENESVDSLFSAGAALLPFFKQGITDDSAGIPHTSSV
jgi:MraZ protein